MSSHKWKNHPWTPQQFLWWILRIRPSCTVEKRLERYIGQRASFYMQTFHKGMWTLFCVNHPGEWEFAWTPSTHRESKNKHGLLISLASRRWTVGGSDLSSLLCLTFDNRYTSATRSRFFAVLIHSSHSSPQLNLLPSVHNVSGSPIPMRNRVDDSDIK
jgi:hypothetical protein